MLLSLHSLIKNTTQHEENHPNPYNCLDRDFGTRPAVGLAEHFEQELRGENYP
jgi:hypothetical protein